MDDYYHIVENPNLRRTPSLWASIVMTARPLVGLSLFLNRSLGGVQVWGYHAVNLGVHLAAGLILFGLLRRTLALLPRTASQAQPLAFAAALLWILHPLQTQAVTYLIQRAEALMGLFTLLTLYSLLRSTTSARPRPWEFAAPIACFLGMASKPTMAVAPLIALLYDRTFLAPSWKTLLAQRGLLHLALALTWIPLAFFLYQGQHEFVQSAGFSLSPLRYTLAQPTVILHYLRLTLWPHPLIFDYAWKLPTSLIQTLPALLVVTLTLLSSILLYPRAPKAAFLPLSFFLLLAPTSSFIPLADLLFEHRMYLPLAPLLTAFTLTTDTALRKALPNPARRLPLALALLLTLALSLSAKTLNRNEDYRNPVILWSGAIAGGNTSKRVYLNLGSTLLKEGKLRETIFLCLEAIRRNPNSDDAHNNLGVALFRTGKTEEAGREFRDALRLNPRHARGRMGLGSVYQWEGKFEQAQAHYEEALRLNPGLIEAHIGLGLLFQQKGELDQALEQYREALRMDPWDAAACNNTGTVHSQKGDWAEAAVWYRRALRTQPDYAQAHRNLGVVLQMQGDMEGAIAHFTRALQLKPDDRTAQENLERALSSLQQSKKIPSSP